MQATKAPREQATTNWHPVVVEPDKQTSVEDQLELVILRRQLPRSPAERLVQLSGLTIYTSSGHCRRDVNRLLQASNPSRAVTRSEATDKVGGPVFFNEMDRFRPVNLTT